MDLPIVDFARRNHPFYKEWLKDGVPILTREIAQEKNTELLNGHPSSSRTSGSTGEPLSLAHDPETIRLIQRSAKSYRQSIGGKPKVISDKSIPTVHAPVEEQAAVIRRMPRKILATYPTNADMLADFAREESFEFSGIERVALFGELLDPAQRRNIEAAFPNAKVTNVYSAMEFGIIAFPCPHSDMLHINEERLFIEFVEGHLIITDLHNQWMPLIRYQIGDCGEEGTCPCGKRSIATLHGKKRGFFVDNDGHRMIFVGLSVDIRDIPGVRQYQAVQDEKGFMVVRVVPWKGADWGEVEGRVLAALDRWKLHGDVDFVDRLEKDPSGKFYHCRSLVPHGTV